MRKPTHVVHDLTGINPEQFHAENPWVEAISYDRDGTVTDYHSPLVPGAHLDVLRGFAQLGVKQGFNSNSSTAESAERVIKVAASISEVIGSEFFVATSYEAGGRKPGVKTFRLFAEKTGVDVGKTVHVGDQWWKDVRGARKAGLRAAILVARYGEGDDGRVRYLQRPTVEMAGRVAFHLPLRVKNFPPTITTLAR